MILLLLTITGSVLGNVNYHNSKGTEYGEKGVAAYAASNHGPDGSLFLDPYFKKHLENSENLKILDAGCGAAPWSIYAALHGSEVYAIDLQEKMIEAGKKAISEAKLEKKIKITQGDVAQLPYKKNFFDKAISICVGCNLPVKTFDSHFLELQRTLKKEGVAIIAAPNSLDVVFSTGLKEESDLLNEIETSLSKLPDNPNSEIIRETLIQFEDVLSATFYLKNGRLALLKDEKELQSGDKIWRKLPKLVVPNHYHSKEDYLRMFKKYNFHLEKTELPHFENEEERFDYNNKLENSVKLGKNYTLHSPFIVFCVKKK